MEFIAGLFTGYILFWPSLIGLAVFGIIFEHFDQRWLSLIILAIVGYGCYRLYPLSLSEIAVGAAAYFVIGIIWSIWRYKRRIAAQVKVVMDNPNLKFTLERLEPSNYWATIVAWVIVWPFSAVENILSDVIDLVDKFLRTFFKKIFVSIYNSGLDEVGGPNK